MTKQNQYIIKAKQKHICGKINIPGSKSITNRALLLGCMAKGKSRLRGALFSDDTRAFIDCLLNLGFDMEINEKDQTILIEGGIPQTKSIIDVRSAGTAARFLSALLCANNGVYNMTSSEQMKKRPMSQLLDVLCDLGAQINYIETPGTFPFTIIGKQSIGGNVCLQSEKSSQFLSALLMTGCLYDSGLFIKTKGKEIAKSYVDITLDMINKFKGQAYRIDNDYFVKGGNTYIAQDYYIEPDVSSSCYFYAMAALTGGTMCVKNVHFSSIQGDVQFIRVLEKMGCTVNDTDKGIVLKGPKKIKRN